MSKAGSIMTLLLVCASPASAFELHPGQWQISSTTTSAALPQTQRQTLNECIKEKTAQEILGTLTEKDICSIDSHEESADTMEWTMKCRQKGSPPMSGNGRIISHGDTFDGEMNVSMKMGEDEMKFQTKWNGKRVGECSKD
jgi:hypothetical protein